MPSPIRDLVQEIRRRRSHRLQRLEWRSPISGSSTNLGIAPSISNLSSGNLVVQGCLVKNSSHLMTEGSMDVDPAAHNPLNSDFFSSTDVHVLPIQTMRSTVVEEADEGSGDGGLYLHKE
ncbi:hypothetical protein L1987_25141 [Smallanthus sonchifolius]|uniref:Uncharacterized protein n=1 Tax=Smallanthus sonchifolius TaxID=185202 RepID=A0ACB9INU7_9ASTR|nr:hypothetical protein L1987_25141 [Smallanthus sonchifolius]